MQIRKIFRLIATAATRNLLNKNYKVINMLHAAHLYIIVSMRVL